MNNQSTDHTTNQRANGLRFLCVTLFMLLLLPQNHAADLLKELPASGKTVFFETPVSGQIPLEDPMAYDLDARVTLGVTATLIETYLKHALTSLRLIAASPATRSGIWPEIRPGLLTMCQAIPGAALYIEPDGNYYSVERGYTSLNLSDRDYFEDLFSGKEIHGSLIYSRSTGKQSVFMAVPVVEGDEVTGAVALSVFLDDFQQMISESLNLPPNYLWYVIDEKASTVLHPRTDFVFMNPADQGSPSLKLAIEDIMAKDEGYTSYVFAGRNTHILFKKIGFNDWRVILGMVGEKVDDEYLPKAYEILDTLIHAIEDQLRKKDRNLHHAVGSFNHRFPPEHIARLALRELYEDNPFVVSAALIDHNGIMVYVEPSDYHLTEGKAIGNMESLYLMHKNKAPMLTASFLALEGFDAVSLQHPVLGANGDFLGMLSLLIRPEIMVEELLTPYIAETVYDPWIMEPEGRIIFDKAFDGTGRMLFLDYRYEEHNTLLALGDMIAGNKTGQSDYIFIDQETRDRIVKMAIWDTLELHGVQWRVILSYPPYD